MNTTTSSTIPGNNTTTTSTDMQPSGVVSSVHHSYPVGTNSMSSHAVAPMQHLTLLEGVDPYVYECARRLIISAPYWTVKGFVDGLKTMHIPASSSSSSSNQLVPIDVSQEQARKLLKQLENDNYMKRTGPASSTKYEVTKLGFEQGKVVSSSTYHPSVSTSQVPFTDPAEEAASWFHRGVIAVLGNYATRKVIKTPHIEYELGLEADIARAVIHHLESLNILGAAGSQGIPKKLGRPINWNDDSPLLLSDAEEYLRTHNLPRPLTPKDEGESGKPICPAKVPPTASTVVDDKENEPVPSITPAKVGGPAAAKNKRSTSTPVTPATITTTPTTTINTANLRKRSAKVLTIPPEETVAAEPEPETPCPPAKKSRGKGKGKSTNTLDKMVQDAMMAACSQSSEAFTMVPDSNTKSTTISTSTSTSNKKTNVWLSKPTHRSTVTPTEITPLQAGMDTNWI